MTPQVFATLVLTAALLLPLNPEIHARATAPVDDIAIPEKAVLIVQDQATKMPVTPEPDAGEQLRSERAKAGGLYLDWWYETSGLWVHNCDHLEVMI